MPRSDEITVIVLVAVVVMIVGGCNEREWNSTYNDDGVDEQSRFTCRGRGRVPPFSSC